MTEHPGHTPLPQPQSQTGRYGPPVHVGRLDAGPEELEWQLPIDGELYRLIPGPDRPDYSIIVLAKPVYFYPTPSLNPDKVAVELQTEDRQGRPMVRSDALVVCARFVGQQLHPGMKDLPVSIAFVIDNKALAADTLDFDTISYAAVGFLSEGSASPTDPAPAAAPTTPVAPAAPAGVAPMDGHTAAEGATGQQAVASPGPTSVGQESPLDEAPVDGAVAGAAAGVAGHAAASGHEPQPVREPAPRDEPEATNHEPVAGVELGEPEHDVEVEEVAADTPPPMVLQNEVLNGLALALRDGIEQNRGADVERMSATLTFDDQNRVTGLSGHADGTPPIPTPATFEKLNEVAAGFADLPPHFRPSSVTMRLDGDHVNHEISYS